MLKSEENMPFRNVILFLLLILCLAACSSELIPPEIGEITTEKTICVSGEKIGLSIPITNPEDYHFTFKWSCTGGTLLNDNTGETTWRAPVIPGSYQLTVEISAEIPDSPFIRSILINVVPISGFNLLLESSPGGNTEPAGSQAVPYNQAFTIRAVPEPGYLFCGWTITSGENMISITDPQAAETTVILLEGTTSLTANFTQRKVLLTVTSNKNNGTTKPTGTSEQPYGKELVIQAFPAEHYTFAGWNLAPIQNGSLNDPGSLITTISLQGNAVVTALFDLQNHQVTFQSVGEGTPGQKTPLSLPYNHGLALSAEPASGWIFSHWAAEPAAHIAFSDYRAPETTATILGDAEITVYFYPERDFLLSTTNTTPQSEPRIALSEKRALIVWEQDSTLRGRILDMETRTAPEEDFKIAPELPARLASGNNYACVVWGSAAGPLRGSIFNLEDPFPVAENLEISMVKAESPVSFDLAVRETEVVILWQEDSGSQYSLYAQAFSLATGQRASLPVEIFRSNAETPAGRPSQPVLALDGKSGFAAWSVEDTENFIQIYGRGFDFGAEEDPGTSARQLNTTTKGYCRNIELELQGNRALAVWDYEDNSLSSPTTVRGRFFDVSFNRPMDTEIIINSSRDEKEQHKPAILLQDNIALVTWSADPVSDGYAGLNNAVKGRYLDFDSRECLTAEFLISRENAFYTFNPATAGDNKRGAVAWTFNDSNTSFVEAAFFPLDGASLGDRKFFQVSETNSRPKSSPAIGYKNAKALVVWIEDNVRARIMEWE